MSDIRRERERRLAVSPQRPHQIAHGDSAFVGQILTAQSAIAAGKFILVTPNDVSGAETEGGPGTLTPTGGAPQPVLLLRGTPKTGDYLICEWADFRWVTEVKTGVICPVMVSISNCFPAQPGTWQLKLTGSPTGGTFRLFAGGQLTAPIAYNASASDVQTALANLSSVGAGNVTCTGGPLPGSSITVTSTVPGLTLTVGASSLTGGTVPAVVVSVVPGNVPPGATATLTSDESQLITITGHPTGGTFTLSWGGSTTAPLPYNVTQAQIAAALVALPSIGTGNLVGGPSVFRGVTGSVVTFQGALARANQPLITATSSLTGDPNATVEVSELLAGGQTIGPVSIDDQTGKAAFTAVPDGQWELTIDAPGYISVTQVLAVNCEAGTGLSGGGQMVPVDGKIVTDGNPSPVDAPSTASLTGDPTGQGSLSLVGCTGGVATYVSAGAGSTVTLLCPNPPQGPCDPTITFTRKIWYIAKFGCSTSLCAVWTASISTQAPGTSLCGDFSQCLATAVGITPCSKCSCSDLLLSEFASDISSQAPCGAGPVGGFAAFDQVGPGNMATIGGGCVCTGTGGWTGRAVHSQLSLMFGSQAQVVAGSPYYSFALTSIPCVSASIG